VNIGPTELVIVLLIFAIPAAAVVLVVIAARASRRVCPACRQPIARSATACPQCGAILRA